MSVWDGLVKKSAQLAFVKWRQMVWSCKQDFPISTWCIEHLFNMCPWGLKNMHYQVWFQKEDSLGGWKWVKVVYKACDHLIRKRKTKGNGDGGSIAEHTETIHKDKTKQQ